MDWKARAEREAAAIIAEALPNASFENYARMVDLVAIGWLQGCIYGTHATLSDYENAYAGLREAL